MAFKFEFMKCIWFNIVSSAAWCVSNPDSQTGCKLLCKRAWECLSRTPGCM